jgi:hypothetical protein
MATYYELFRNKQFLESMGVPPSPRPDGHPVSLTTAAASTPAAATLGDILNWTHAENCTHAPQEAAGWRTMIVKGPPGIFLNQKVLLLQMLNAVRSVGPGGYCSPRHRMPIGATDSRDEGSECVG